MKRTDFACTKGFDYEKMVSYFLKEEISMAIEPNQVVTINFTMKDTKGAIVDSTVGQEPYTFLSNSDQMLPKVEDVLRGMKVGNRSSVVLSPEDAYGVYEEDAVMVAKRSDFLPDAELKEGMTFVTVDEGQEMPVTIKQIDGDDITLDYNHPLAGETLSFDLELLEVRDATPEELSQCHEHGCGCGH